MQEICSADMADTPKVLMSAFLAQENITLACHSFKRALKGVRTGGSAIRKNRVIDPFQAIQRSGNS